MTRRVPRPLHLFLLTLVLVLVGLGLRFGPSIYRKQVAINEVRRLGGDVYVRMPGPKWLSNHLPAAVKSLFSPVSSVSLSSPAIDDDDLALLNGFPEVTALSLDRSRVTDEGLLKLGGLEHLEVLDVSHTAISDTGLWHLKKLPRLRQICAVHSGITWMGVDYMAPSSGWFIYTGTHRGRLPHRPHK
jgi:hypothetical protein